MECFQLSDSEIAAKDTVSICRQIETEGFARLALTQDDHDLLSRSVRSAVRDLERSSAFDERFHLSGDKNGLPVGFHYFPTNSVSGRTGKADGVHESLSFSRTWDFRAGSNPDWPEVDKAQSHFSQVSGTLASVARRVARSFERQDRPEWRYAAKYLNDCEHNGTVLRTVMSRGAADSSDESQTALTRHVWHTDATLWTLLSLQDFATPKSGVSATDRLVYETTNGMSSRLEPIANQVIIFPGRHLSALVGDTNTIRPWRHAVVSSNYSLRTVTMLRIGFSPSAVIRNQQNQRSITTRDGAPIRSGADYYKLLTAQRGRPIILAGTPVPVNDSHRGQVRADSTEEVQ